MPAAKGSARTPLGPIVHCTLYIVHCTVYIVNLLCQKGKELDLYVWFESSVWTVKIYRSGDFSGCMNFKYAQNLKFAFLLDANNGFKLTDIHCHNLINRDKV